MGLCERRPLRLVVLKEDHLGGGLKRGLLQMGKGGAITRQVRMGPLQLVSWGRGGKRHPWWLSFWFPSQPSRSENGSLGPRSWPKSPLDKARALVCTSSLFSRGRCFQEPPKKALGFLERVEVASFFFGLHIYIYMYKACGHSNGWNWEGLLDQHNEATRLVVNQHGFMSSCLSWLKAKLNYTV